MSGITRTVTRGVTRSPGVLVSEGGHRGCPRRRTSHDQHHPLDFEAIKKAQRAGWETGDYPRVGNTLQIIAELLVEAADVRAGQRVLDVACGQGNAAMAAARRFADATGVDYATNLLAQGRERAAAEHLPVTFTEGDAENLPLPDASFDLVAQHGRRDVRAGPPARGRRTGPGDPRRAARSRWRAGRRPG